MYKSGNNFEVEYYDVLIRSQKTYEDPQNYNQVRALANDLSSFTNVALDNTSDGTDVTTNNGLYLCDASSGNIAIDLASAVLTELEANDGDVLIFKVTDTDTGSNTVTITDEDSTATVLDNVNDTIVFIFDYSSTKWLFGFMAIDGDTANQASYFAELGVMEEGPQIMTESEDGKKTNKGSTLKAKVVKSETNDLQVTKDNSEYYDTLVTAGRVDLFYYCSNNPQKSVFLLNQDLRKYLSIKGNDWNTIPLNTEQRTNIAGVRNMIRLISVES